jgi:peptidyl-prolyl cis-trans isomerase C
MDHPPAYRYLVIFMLFLLSGLAAAACGEKPPTTAASTPTLAILLTETVTPTLVVSLTPSQTPTPTLTPEPLAAEVNGEGITLAEYQAELGRYQVAMKTAGAPVSGEAAQKTVVLDELIDQTLLSQAAIQDGFKVTDADLQSRIDKMAVELGGTAALLDWETKNGYTDASFRQALRRAMTAAWQRDQILAGVPTTVEQVHARQILVFNKIDANLVLTRLKSGSDFATLALGYDQLTGGDLGWFPRGYLPVPEVEAAAFALQPGEYSQVIESKIGFHVIQVIEKSALRPLSTDALQSLQRQALHKWIEEQRAKSQITIY